jgi:hypothetical protein
MRIRSALLTYLVLNIILSWTLPSSFASEKGFILSGSGGFFSSVAPGGLTDAHDNLTTLGYGLAISTSAFSLGPWTEWGVEWFTGAVTTKHASVDISQTSTFRVSRVVAFTHCHPFHDLHFEPFFARISVGIGFSSVGTSLAFTTDPHAERVASSDSTRALALGGGLGYDYSFSEMFSVAPQINLILMTFAQQITNFDAILRAKVSF